MLNTPSNCSSAKTSGRGAALGGLSNDVISASHESVEEVLTPQAKALRWEVYLAGDSNLALPHAETRRSEALTQDVQER